MQNDPLVNQEEAAELLGVSPSTMNGWRVQKLGPEYIQLSARCIRYELSALEKFINSKRRIGAEARRIEQTSTS